MTGKELWEQYQHYTHDFTDHARQLGFAGAAICWLFRDAEFRFPLFIYFALLLFVCYFVSDILQSISGALTLRFYTEAKEKKMWRETGSIEGEILKPRWVDVPAFVMFCAKAIFLVGGFGFIAGELAKRIVE